MRNFKIDKTFQHIIFFAGGMFCFLLWAYLWFYDINGIQRKVFFSDSYDWFMDFYNPIYYAIGKTPYTWGRVGDRSFLPLMYMVLYPLIALYPYEANADIEGGGYNIWLATAN